ncbi:MAG TPA: ABC-F family ATP-binding cassette domain-containing protein [Candidatus Heimdallarchaeota archaeon]|nr:ABC-F family ATP-binding cassette domain-containing protein [Candidatus Heimdallarchaeota archaeon]
MTDINWAIQPGKRSALIGPNGAGKTTLLRLIIGELEPDKGKINRPREYHIGYLPQEEIDVRGDSVLDTALAGHEKISELERKIEEAHLALDASLNNQDKLLKKLGDLEHHYEALGGYRLESIAKTILSGLGFSEADFLRPQSELSGGWRMRVYLARLLLRNPDLLLLDEPTNHLDLPSLEWLEQYLLQFTGSVVLVSHDRFFIDRLAYDVYELDHGRLERYAGNYHFFEREKEKRIQLQRKKIETLEAERKRQERFIERFRAKNTKATQVQSRIKQLEKLEKIELPPSHRRINFQLSVEVKSYKDVLHIEDMSFRYQEPWVLKDVNLIVSRKERVALVGANGAGKTTLTRLIVNQFSPQRGSISLGKRTSVGYYAQHQLDMLDPDANVYDEVFSSAAESHIPRIRDVLGAFQFSGDDVFKKIKVLSGGEKARVSLAKILLSPVNFLIMDEPTNHLDLASVEALELALTYYEGTLLLISHDRYFLDKIVGRIIELKEGELTEYLGNYSDYLAKRMSDPAEGARTGTKERSHPIGRKTKDQKRLEAEARQAISRERNRLEKEIARIEEKIDGMETRMREIEEKLAHPETYQNGKQVAQFRKEYTRLKKDLEESIDSWEKDKLELEELLNSLR